MMGSGSGRGEDRATEATEAAIKSPLLEDVDLKGASGILVNITAGLDLSLGEFSEVGNIVEEYASENATIVVGTVIDPELTDELTVTVVATGLGRAGQQQVDVVNTGTGRASAVAATSGAVSDFDQLELPAVMRSARKDSAQRQKAEPIEIHREIEQEQPVLQKTGTDDMEFLDIPAFLRRQAD